MTPAFLTQRDDVGKALELSIERRPDPATGGLSDADAAWPKRLRRVTRAALESWGRPDLIEKAELLLTELATNALRHGHGRDIGVRIYLRGDRCVIEVNDGSPDCPTLRHASPIDEGGRGLFLVDAMAETWGVSPDGTTTWCTLSLHEGPDDHMQPVPPPPVTALRRYPTIEFPADADALSRAERIARVGLRAINWDGSIDTATDVLVRLVQNAVDHAAGEGRGDQIRVSLVITRRGLLIIDVADPSPEFPNADEALRGERGKGLAEVRACATLTWFGSPDVDGKTVRAVMDLNS